MRTPLTIPFWERAKKLIKAHKISQKDFAAYTGINYYTLKNWMHYGIIPDANSTYTIANALGVSMEYLTTGIDGEAMKIREEDARVRKIAAANIKKMASLIEKDAALIG